MLWLTKISFLIVACGVVTVSGSPITSDLKHRVFQPASASALSSAKVIQPAKSLKWSKASKRHLGAALTLTPTNYTTSKIEIQSSELAQPQQAIAPLALATQVRKAN
jgi:hypothetical protein